ncbi:hypothetical protein DL546_004494 [Coniochaeta pulveracea]|uniref:Uncharacterized protein n=1 Tax=Coniochaeta pulveracea TaxID=177199 RepID=A0A420Y4B6_9PEZI|nr:hypothetical protein DL546_004494 [Coniochaeta pulveracea]
MLAICSGWTNKRVQLLTLSMVAFANSDSPGHSFGMLNQVKIDTVQSKGILTCSWVIPKVMLCQCMRQPRIKDRYADADGSIDKVRSRACITDSPSLPQWLAA